MDLFFRVFSNTGCIHTSPVNTLSDEGQCVWKQHFSLPASSQLKNEDFIFSFLCLFKKGTLIFPWFDKRIHCTSLMSGSDSFNARRKSKLMRSSGTLHGYAEKMQVEVSLHYDAELKYVQCTQIECAISSVVMKSELGFAKAAMDAIWISEYHKVVCLVRLGTGRAKRNIYLGRPQRIFHYPFAVRRMEWVLQDAAASPFPGMSVKTDQYWKEHEEQHADMRRINALIEPLTARAHLPKQDASDYEPDHDGLVNAMTQSTIAVDKEPSVAVQFFNLGIRVGAHLPWTEFDAKKHAQRAAERDGLTFFVDTHEGRIHRIVLEANQYHQSLRFENTQLSRIKSL